jgi:hypothetical protein
MKTFKESVIKQIKNNTNNNSHIENLVIIAKELNDADLVSATQSLLNLHKFFGHFPQHLKLAREQISEELFKRIEEKFENHEEISNIL